MGTGCILCCPKEQTVREFGSAAPKQCQPVQIGDRTAIMNHVIIYEGTVLGDAVFVDDRVRIGYGCSVGARSRLMYGAFICDRVTVGADARVAGFICDACLIEDSSTVMGNLVHEYSSPDANWWAPDEPAPVIRRESVVGFGAVVIGRTQIGPRSYVAAGAIVTRDVPSEHICIGTNHLIPCREWKGDKLQRLIASWGGAS